MWDLAGLGSVMLMAVSPWRATVLYQILAYSLVEPLLMEKEYVEENTAVPR